MVFSPRRCHNCLSRKLKTIVDDTLDGHTILECHAQCQKCGYNTAYWAYGHWDDPIYYMKSKLEKFKYLYLGILKSNK